MFKCCICHREYSTKEAAVKCVNECSRKMTADGVFKPKSAPQGETVNKYEYSDSFNEVQVTKEEVITLCSKLISAGANKQQIDSMQDKALTNWNLKPRLKKKLNLKDSKFLLLCIIYDIIFIVNRKEIRKCQLKLI